MLKTYFATYSIDILALCFLYMLLHSSNILDSYRKKPFLFGIILTVLIILSEAGTIVTGNGSTELRTFNIVCNIFGFALTPMIPIALIAITDLKFLKTHKLLMLPTFINIVAALLSPMYNLIFSISADNQYQRGNYFFLFVLVYIINIIFLFISTFNMCNKLRYPIKWKALLLTVFTVAGTSIQLVDPSIYSSWHCVTLSLILYFLFLSEFDNSFDALTGLYNRATFEKMVKQIKSRKPFAVIVLDIDDFKIVNDTYGHDYGDTALKSIAKIIRLCLDSHYVCYRIGGDEFCIICNKANHDEIEYQLGSMIKALSIERGSDNRLPTVAYGYSVFEGGKSLDFQKVLKEADDQMYYFKKLRKEDHRVISATEL